MEGSEGRVLRGEFVSRLAAFLKGSEGGGFGGVYLEGPEWLAQERNMGWLCLWL